MGHAEVAGYQQLIERQALPVGPSTGFNSARWVGAGGNPTRTIGNGITLTAHDRTPLSQH